MNTRRRPSPTTDTSPASAHDRASAAGRRLLDELRPEARAWSVNGRDLSFVAGFDLEVSTGGFLTVTLDDGTRLLAQVFDRHLAERSLARVEVDTSAFDEALADGGLVQGASVDMAVRFIEGSGRVLGRLDGDAFRRGGSHPFAQAAIGTASAAEIEAAIGAPDPHSAGLAVGRLVQSDVEVHLRAAGFARHTFLCGQSGSGKTYSMGVLLEQLLLETTLPMVIVDPNSDHVHLGTLRSVDELNHGRSRPLSRRAVADLRRRHAASGRVLVARRGAGADLPLQIRPSDLTLAEQAITLGLHPVADGDEYSALVDAVEQFAGRHYGIDDLLARLRAGGDEASRRLAQRITNLGVHRWSVWAPLGSPSLADLTAADWRVVVLDTGSLSDARERAVVSLALLGLLRRRPERRSVLVVMDEAHNICPPEADTELGRAVTEQAVWIAGEGRKFGIHLLLATQRPQKVHHNVVSQCDNLLLMRVNSSDDLRQLARVFSHVPESMVAESSTFGLGEVLAAGPVVPTPLRLQMGVRLTPEGGADLPTDWARPRSG